MNKYAQTAVMAVEVVHSDGISPVESWQRAAKIVFCESSSSRRKGCPKNAFLGLCEEGLVKGVPRGHYTNSVMNKEYAVKAVKFLEKYRNPSIMDLWKAVGGVGKTHNSQMNVVIALCKAGFLIPLGEYEKRKIT